MGKALQSVTAGSSKALGETTLPPAADFVLVFSDGDEYIQPPPAQGWARAQRLPSLVASVAQIGFVWQAHSLGEVLGNKQVRLSPGLQQQQHPPAAAAAHSQPSCPTQIARMR